MERIYSFAPIADQHCKILILGSMPGAESLRKQQYYGFVRNSFWRIMYTLHNEPFSEDYNERKRFLLRNEIALWDVIHTCERQGSLDAKIRNAVANDFASFFASHPRIRRVFFNGKAAQTIFKKQVGFDFAAIVFDVLGSTSPAHAITFEQRLEDWQKVLDSEETA